MFCGFVYDVCLCLRYKSNCIRMPDVGDWKYYNKFQHSVPVEAMENCSELFCNKSLHAYLDVILMCLVTSSFISTTLDGVTFSRVKNSRNTCKCLYHTQTSWRDFLCNGGKLETSEEYTCLLDVSSVLESK